MIQITVSSTITATGCTKIVIEAAKKALTIPNPAYHRIARLTGNAWAAQRDFKYYKLVKADPSAIIMPRGFEGRFKAYLDKQSVPYEITYDLIKKRARNGFKDWKAVELRDYQVPIVYDTLQAMQGVLAVATGGGKTVLSCALTKELGMVTTIIVPNTVIAGQFRNEFKRWFNYDVGMVGMGEKTIKDVTVALWQSLSSDEEVLHKLAEQTGLLIADECFVGDTAVLTQQGYKKIKDIKVGDLVHTPTGFQRVIKTIQNKTKKYLNITIGGKQVGVTANHPILTDAGWKKAGELAVGDKVLNKEFVYDTMWSNIDSLTNKYGKNKKLRNLQKRISTEIRHESKVLFPQLRSTESRKDSEMQSNNGDTSITVKKEFECAKSSERKPSNCRSGEAENVGKEPNETRKNTRKDEANTFKNRTLPNNQGRQRERPPSSTKDFVRRAWKRLVSRISCADKKTESKRLSNMLQNRFGKPNSYDRDRNRWWKPLYFRKTETRQEEGTTPYFFRVEDIQVQERGGAEQYREDFTVYNLEIENCPMYVVNEFVAHNCHGATSAERAKILQQFKPSRLYGMSGSPRRSKDDGRTDAIFFTFGPIVAKYEATQVEPEIDVIFTKVEIPVDDFAVMEDRVVADESRNKLIAGIALGEVGEGRKVLILCKRREHCEKLMELFPKSDMIWYADSDDKTRNDTLMAMRNGDREFSIVVGTVSLLATGTDIPALNRLILASSVKSDVMVAQEAGRILRLFEGKDSAKIYDLVDKNPIYYNHFRERQRFYESKRWKINGIDFTKKK